MATEEMGKLLNQIGQQVANFLGRVPDDVFVFIEAADQMSGGAIFENLPDQVIYHEFGNETHDTILELWDAAPPDKKGRCCFTISRMAALMPSSCTLMISRMNGTRLIIGRML